FSVRSNPSLTDVLWTSVYALYVARLCALRDTPDPADRLTHDRIAAVDDAANAADTGIQLLTGADVGAACPRDTDARGHADEVFAMVGPSAGDMYLFVPHFTRAGQAARAAERHLDALRRQPGHGHIARAAELHL